MRICSRFFFSAAIILVAGFQAGGKVAGQTEPTSQPATRPILTNIEAVMEREVPEFITEKMPLKEAIAKLKDAANANIVANWTALAAVGIDRDAVVTLHLKKVNTEQVVRALCEAMSEGAEARLNYVVGEGAVEITTNRALGHPVVTRVMDIAKLFPSDLVKDQRAAREKLLLAIFAAELQRVGEAEGEDREVRIKSDYLVVKQSMRGVMGIQRVITALGAGLKPGSVPPWVVASVRQKKAEAAMLGLLEKKVTLREIAGNPEKVAADLSVVCLISGRDALLPGGERVTLDYLVNEAGVVYIGSAADIRSRTVFAVYDVRDVVKKLQMKGESKNVGAEELAERVAVHIKEKVTPGIWAELGKGPCTVTVCGQSLVVFAPAPVYRLLGAVWKDLEK